MAVNVATLQAQLKADVSPYLAALDQAIAKDKEFQSGQSQVQQATATTNQRLTEHAAKHTEAGNAAHEAAARHGEAGAAIRESGIKATESAADLLQLQGAHRQATEAVGYLVKAMSEETGLFGGLAIAGAGLIVTTLAVGAAATELAATWQHSMTMLSNQANLPETQVAAIGTAIQDLSTHTVASSGDIAASLTNVAARWEQYTGQALTAQQATQLMTTANQGAMASGQDLAGVTDGLVRTMIAFHEPTTQQAAVMDVLYNTSRLTGMGIDEIATSVDRMQARMGASAPTLQDTATLLDAISATGMNGQRAAMMVTQGFENLIKPSTEGAKVIKELGLNVTDSQGRFVGMASIIEQLNPKWAGMTEAQRDFAASALFGAGAEGTFNHIIEDGAEKFRQYNEAVTESGTTAEGAGRESEDFHAKVDMLGHTLEAAGQSAGEAFLPAMTAVADGAKDAAETLRSDVVPKIEDFTDGVGEKLGALGDIASQAMSPDGGMADSLDALQGTVTNWHDDFVDWIAKAQKDAGTDLDKFGSFLDDWSGTEGDTLRQRVTDVWVPALVTWVLGEAWPQTDAALTTFGANMVAKIASMAPAVFQAGVALGAGLAQGIAAGIQGAATAGAGALGGTGQQGGTVTPLMVGEAVLAGAPLGPAGVFAGLSTLGGVSLAGAGAAGAGQNAQARNTQQAQQIAWNDAVARGQIQPNSPVLGPGQFEGQFYNGQYAEGVAGNLLPRSSAAPGGGGDEPAPDAGGDQPDGVKKMPTGPGNDRIQNLMNQGGGGGHGGGHGGGGKVEDPIAGLMQALADNKSRYEEAFGQAGGAMASALDKALTDGTTAAGEQVGNQINTLAVAMQKAGVEDVQPQADELAGYVLQALASKDPAAIEQVHDMVAKMNTELETKQAWTKYEKDATDSQTKIKDAVRSTAQQIDDSYAKAGLAIQQAGRQMADTTALNAAKKEVDELTRTWQASQQAMEIAQQQADAATDRATTRANAAADMAESRVEQLQDRQVGRTGQDQEISISQAEQQQDLAEGHQQRLADIAKQGNSAQQAQQVEAENLSFARAEQNAAKQEARQAAATARQRAREDQQALVQQQREDARAGLLQAREDAQQRIADQRAADQFADQQAKALAAIAYKDTLEKGLGIDEETRARNQFNQQIDRIRLAAQQQEDADNRHLLQTELTAEVELQSKIGQLQLDNPHAQGLAEAMQASVDRAADFQTQLDKANDALQQDQQAARALFDAPVDATTSIYSTWADKLPAAAAAAQDAYNTVFAQARADSAATLANAQGIYAAAHPEAGHPSAAAIGQGTQPGAAAGGSGGGSPYGALSMGGSGRMDAWTMHLAQAGLQPTSTGNYAPLGSEDTATAGRFSPNANQAMTGAITVPQAGAGAPTNGDYTNPYFRNGGVAPVGPAASAVPQPAALVGASAKAAATPGGAPASAGGGGMQLHITIVTPDGKAISDYLLGDSVFQNGEYRIMLDNLKRDTQGAAAHGQGAAGGRG